MYLIIIILFVASVLVRFAYLGLNLWLVWDQLLVGNVKGVVITLTTIVLICSNMFREIIRSRLGV